MIQILIVDDEKPICDLIQMSLTRAGYHCTCVYDGLAAADILERNVFDLILLDVMLPNADGFELMEYIRPLGIPVIFLTARGSVDDRVRGLRMGAEDYIVKPFEIVTLLVRIEKVLARTGRLNQVYRFRDLTLDAENRTLTYAGEPIDLPPLEFDVLAVLMKNKNRTVSRERILNEIWGEDYFGDIRTVDVRVANLRKKLNLSEAIRTISKAGYRLEER